MVQLILDNFFLLMHFAKKGAVSNRVGTSTLMASRELSISQQSVSRKLNELAAGGLIELSSSPKGVQVSITQRGKKLLLENLDLLSGIFSKNHKKNFNGIVESGLGEGKYYMSFPQYQKQIEKKLGFKPYFGTLNLKVSEHELSFFVKNQKIAVIEGFSTKQRTFGGLRAIKVKINNVLNGALIFPDRSTHPKNVCELIAPVYLRKKFSLEDDSVVSVFEDGSG